MLQEIQQNQSLSNPDQNPQHEIFTKTIEESVMTRNRTRKPSELSNAKPQKTPRKRKNAGKHKPKKVKSPQKKKKIDESDFELLPLIDPASPINPYEEEKKNDKTEKNHVFFCYYYKL